MDKWTKSDKKIAKELFELARKRDYQKLMNEIQLIAKNLEESQSIWDLRDFLNESSHQ